MKFSRYGEGTLRTLFSQAYDVRDVIKNTLANEEVTKDQLLETLVVAYDHSVSVKDFSTEFNGFDDQLLEYRSSKQKEREEERKVDAVLEKYRAKEA